MFLIFLFLSTTCWLDASFLITMISAFHVFVNRPNVPRKQSWFFHFTDKKTEARELTRQVYITQLVSFQYGISFFLYVCQNFRELD